MLFGCCLPVFSQKKLRYDIIKESGDTLFRSPEQRLYTKAGRSGAVGELLSSTVYKSSKGFMIAFSIQTGRTNTFSVSKDSPVELRLQDGTTVKLYTLLDHNSRQSLLGYGGSMTVFYELPPLQLGKLRAGQVTYIRILSSTGNMDYDLKEKAGTIIAEQIAKFGS
jgi:hypothetical protein